MKQESGKYQDPNYSPKTLVDLLRWRAVTEPDTRAYTYIKDGDKKEIHLTYGELDKRARSIAAALRRKGLEGQRALLLYPPGLDYISGFFGCLYAGVIAVPAYPPDPNRLNRSLPRLQAIVNDAKATVALTTDSILYMIRMLKLGSKMSKTLERMPFLRKFRSSMKYFSSGKSAVAESRELGDLEWLSTDAMLSGMGDNWQAPGVNKDTIAFLQYTSGSTGSPKGVILTHDNLLANSEIIYNAIGYSQDGEGVFWLPIYHDMGLIGGVLQPLYGRIPSTLMSPIVFLQRPLRWLEVISRIESDFIGSAAPNFAYELCIKKATPEKVKTLDLSSWKMALSGAEPVRHHTIERFSEIFKEAGFRKKAFFPAYGLAEATLFVTGATFQEGPVYLNVDKHALKKNKILETPTQDDNSQTLVSSGKNQPGQRTAIVNPDTAHECKPGEIGEIWVKGPSVSPGYYERPEETSETFQNYIAGSNDGPYLRTGDLGFIREGEVFVTGRVKDLIIIRGTNHYPQDIELTVERSHPELRPGCTAAFTIDIEDEEQLVIVQEVRHSRNIDTDDIFQHIRQAVSEHHDLQAHTIVLIKARTINKTSSGKIQRSATRNDFLNDNLKEVARWERGKESFQPATPEPREEKEKQETERPPSKVKSDQTREIEQWLVHHLAELLGANPQEIDIRQPFISFGLDSAQAVGLAGDLEEWLGRELSPTLIWDYPTIEALARHLALESAETVGSKRVRHKTRYEYEPVAVIGVGLRFPGANNHNEFWEMLKNGIDGISEVPSDRWDAEAFYDPTPGTIGKMITKHGGFLSRVDQFDPNFFGIAPREARQIDPQQRLLMEVSWEAFEHAGLTLEQIAGSRTGVFIGISANDYSRIQKGGPESINPYSGTGNAFSIASNRLSYLFDLRGPSISVDTACSSSLVSVHNACQGLRQGECDMALAGGVNLILSPELNITFSQANMISADGRCKTFDANADGYGRGEGAGVVVLKRLSDAIRDRDHVLAVIKGSAINQDGRSNGITAPNSLAQQAVINDALDNADISPDQIQYLETHGTGTPLGDPIEIESIKKTMLQERSKDNTLYIGSAKTNIGHLEAAAGIAGLIKLILSIMHEEIPPHINFKELNPHIRLENTPIKIASENIPWKRSEKLRMAAISSFGFGGTNAHMILSEPEKSEVSDEERGQIQLQERIMPITAHSRAALKDRVMHIRRFLQQTPQTAETLYDVLYRLSLKRSHLDHRFAVIAENHDEFSKAMDAYIHDDEKAPVVTGRKDANLQHKIVFVFSGQGPQWYGMGHELMQKEPVFKATVDRISILLEEYCGWKLDEALAADEEHSRLNETEVAQPALFAIQVALAALCRSWGMVPDAVIGHSVGEVAAAHVAGILSLDSAVKVIYHRSRLMQQATGLGKMAAVDLPYDALKEVIAGFEHQLSLGARNSVTSNVISGEETAVDEVLKKLGERDVFYKKLPVNYAFHSPQMEPYKKELMQALEGIDLQSINIPIISTVTGDYAAEQDYGAEYWGQNIRECVQFSDGINRLLGDGYNTFIEIGPHPVLRNYIQQNVSELKKNVFVLPSLRRKEPEKRRMLTTLARLWTMGYPVDWEKLYPLPGQFIDLPPYPFQRQRYWIDDQEDVTERPAESPTEYQADSVHPLLGVQQASTLMTSNSNWSIQLKSDFVAYLNNHSQTNAPVFPESAYLEMAVAASQQTFKDQETVLRNIVFKNVLKLKQNETRQLHFSLTPVSANTAYFQAFSKSKSSQGRPSWTMHSFGSIVREETPQNGFELKTPESLKSTMQPEGDIRSFFRVLQKVGMDANGISQSCETVYKNENESLIQMRLPVQQTADWKHYHIHPLVLNYAFHILTATAMQHNGDDLYAAHSLDYLKLYKQPATDMWVHVKLYPTTSEQTNNITSDLYLFDGQGNPLLEARGLRLRVLPGSMALANIVYETDWKKLTPAGEANKNLDASDKWIILDDGHHGSLFQKELQIKSKAVVVLPYQHFIKNGAPGTEALKKQLSEQLGDYLGANVAVLFLWGLSGGKNDSRSLEILSELLREQKTDVEHFYVFTRSALALASNAAEADPRQSLLWDTGARLQSNHPDLNIRLFDVEGAMPRLAEVLQLPPSELRLASRNGSFYGARLAPSIDFTTQGYYQQYDQIQLPSKPRKTLAEQEVEIEVKAAGLSKSDVALLKDSSTASGYKGGTSCAGVIAHTGKAVTQFKPGDAVIALGSGTLYPHVTLRQEFVSKKPEHLNFEEAAALPYDFVTAYYALVYLGRLQSNETVFIQDGASPLGLAAMLIALQHGSRIFATADTSEKKALLKKYGAEEVFDSNSLEYVDQISELTEGKGVDIIVNTSSFQQVAHSFSILKSFGRFLELSTGDTFEQALYYHHLRRNISFFAIDMLNVANEQPGLTREIMDEAMQYFNKHDFKLPRLNIFTLNHLGHALYLMEQDKRLGKFILTLRKDTTKDISTVKLLDTGGQYLIAGVFDENEVALLQWLNEQGARRFILQPLHEEGRDAIKRSRKRLKGNVEIDVFDPDKHKNTEVKGVIISTSGLDPEISADTFLQNLEMIYDFAGHSETDFFITVSSFTHLYQQPAGIKRLCPEETLTAFNQRRTMEGRPALQLSLDGEIPKDRQIAFQRWNILRTLIKQNEGYLIISEMDWDAFFKENQGDQLPALYEYFQKGVEDSTQTSSVELDGDEITRAALMAESPEDRRVMLEAYLRKQIAGVVGIDPEQIAMDQSLMNLGIDSLMAIELKNTVESRLGLTLPIATLLQGPTVNDLCEQFLPQLSEASGSEEVVLQPKQESERRIQEYELSHGQKAMYFQHVMAPESIFNLAYAVRIRSEFDKDKLQQSFQVLVDRHTSLRTTFHMKDGQPIQRIHPDMPAFFYEEDVSEWTEQQLKKRLDEEVLRHFDLENGPLMRVFLFRKAEKDHILLFVMHHIVTDMWSQALLLNELSLIFNEPQNTSVLPILKSDYTDYIRWQNQLLQNEGERLLGFWKEQLRGDLPLLNIPTDRPRPSVQTYRGSTETIWFGDELSDQVKRFCEQHGVTVFTALLAAYYVLLYRYTGQKDIIVGSPTAGRTRNEFANVIGYFVNPLPFRTQLDGTTRFDTFVKQVKETALQVFDHMDYPLSLLVEKIHPQRDTSRTPLFQTMFILQRAHLMHDEGLSQFALSREGASLDLGGLTIESMELEQGVAPFDLTMMTVESGTGLAASLGYNVDLFDQTTIKRMLQHFASIVRELVNRPQKPVSDVRMLSEQEEQKLLFDYNDTQTPLELDICVHQVFERCAEETPEKTALVFKEQQLSYDELNKRSNQLAHFLIDQGIGPEVKAGICIERSVEMVVAMLGVLKAGGAYVPIDPTYPQERIAYMFKDAQLPVILTQQQLSNKFQDDNAKVIILDNGQETIWNRPNHNPDSGVLPENIAYLIYTSGSTGKPKGAMLQHRGLINAISSTVEKFYVHKDANVLQFASFSFDASVEEIFSTLITGATLYLSDQESLRSLPDLIAIMRENSITNITLPPSVLSVLQPQDFPSLQSVVSAGEKCPVDVARRWSEGRYLINGYGPTEATICSATYVVENDFDRPVVPIGRPVKNVRVYILDEDLNPVPVGVPGELYISGEGLARGYFERPELTAERFIPDPFAQEPHRGARMYKTGDLVRYLKDGNIEFIGRLDHQVKIRGFRIELGEIEAVVKEHAAVSDAAVIAKQNGSEKRIVAYVVPQESKSFDKAQLQVELKRKLPDFMVPSAVISMEALPLNANGKLDRKALPDPDTSQRKGRFVKPGTETERKLAEIWQEILKLDRIGVNDSFFDLGGHSLSIVQAQGKIKEVFDKELSVVALFQYPTISTLAAHIDEASASQKTIKKSQDRGSRQREATRLQQQRMRNRRKN